ncbi:hypothetical protein N0V88_006651 [Collariella sp. IMI 366227]|nr:hypothetical protein N0V88_006651 [Collariella sp. IMI 366227]
MPAAVASQWRDRRRRMFQSVFQTDVVHPAPQSTPTSRSADTGQPLSGPGASLSAHPLPFSQPQKQHQTHHGHGHTLHVSGEHTFPGRITPEPSSQTPTAQPLFSSLTATGADDQATYDRAWHIVTAHIALPFSATADDSFGTLAANSQQQQRSSHRTDTHPDFYDAFVLLVNAAILLPRATRTDDILAWHVRQARAHFSQHVVPLLAGCVDHQAEESGDDDSEHGNERRPPSREGNHYKRHMFIVMSSIRTLEAALRLYFYGLNQLLSGFSRMADSSPEVAKDAEVLNARFRRDIHALVSNSVSEGLLTSVKAVFLRLAGTILGIPSRDEPGVERVRPAPPKPNDLKVQAARERLLELAQQLHNVGLAGERFQVLFAEVMDAMMCAFVTGAYAGVWSAPDPRSFSTAMDSVSRRGSLTAASPCIMSLNDWIENHFARLSFEVLSCIPPNPKGPFPVPLAELKTYQSLALGRLAALRIQELFDIVLAWPASRPALDDLRATITTPARRKQLTDSFSRALQTRLLHAGCSTLEILRTYIAIIRTLHALDPSKVLLSHVEQGLQLYLCQREDAVRVVVAGLLASPEEIRAARKAKDVHKRPKDRLLREDSGHSKLPTKLVELALILNDPTKSRRPLRSARRPRPRLVRHVLGADPVDAGANYRRPKSEDVIGTLIEALGGGGTNAAAVPSTGSGSGGGSGGAGGSADVFIKEFSLVVAERLLSRSPGGDNYQQQNVRFDQEMRVLELLKKRFGEAALQNCDVMIKDVVQDSRKVDAAMGKIRRSEGGGGEKGDMEYHAKILSRLFWPGLEREHFLLPETVVARQREYEKGYEDLKAGRKLTWLNQLGQARVELELKDRTVGVDCSTVEATVVYAFQGAEDSAEPAKKSVDDLYEQLQMDEDLITAALHFWVNHGVLRRASSPPNTYVVAETLADTTNNPPTATPMKPHYRSSHGRIRPVSKSAVSAKERERRDMYWRYIQGMLTNASATMPLAQMAMMMKMLITDGFAWGNEELQEFLAEKVTDGEMEYRLVKK